MKIKNIFLTLAVAVAGSACSDWFDVSPKTDIKTEDLPERTDRLLRQNDQR